MITKLIAWTIATSELENWSSTKTGLIVTAELLLSLLLIPLFMIAVCLKAMFMK